MRRRAFGESPIIALFQSGVKEVKGLSTSERSGEVDRSEAQTLDGRGAAAPFLEFRIPCSGELYACGSVCRWRNLSELRLFMCGYTASAWVLVFSAVSR
jgi:hypothetical protein